MKTADDKTNYSIDNKEEKPTEAPVKEEPKEEPKAKEKPAEKAPVTKRDMSKQNEARAQYKKIEKALEILGVNKDILRDGKVIKILRANNIEWTASEQDYVNEQNITRIDFGGGVIATVDRGDNNNAPTYYDSGTSIRMYANNTLTLHGSDIKKVIFFLLNDIFVFNGEKS